MQMSNVINIPFSMHVMRWFSILEGIVIVFISSGLSLIGLLIFTLHLIEPPTNNYSISVLITKDLYLFLPILVLLIGTLSIISGWYYGKRRYWAKLTLEAILWLELLVIIGVGIYLFLIALPPGILTTLPHFTDILGLIAPFAILFLCLVIGGIQSLCLLHIHSQKIQKVFQN